MRNDISLAIPELSLVAIPPGRVWEWLTFDAWEVLRRSDVIYASAPDWPWNPGAPSWSGRVEWDARPIEAITHRALNGERVAYLARQPMASDPVVQALNQADPWKSWAKRYPSPWAITLAADYLGVPQFPESSRTLALSGSAGQRVYLSAHETELRQGSEGASAAGPEWLLTRAQVSARPQAMAWWSARPLRGRRVAILRAGPGALEAAADLRAWGAEVAWHPLFRIVPAASTPELTAAWAHLEQYAWIIFTSQEAVRHTVDRLLMDGQDLRRLGGQLAVVGQETARVLSGYGLKPALSPDPAAMNQDGLAAAFDRIRVSGVRILWPTGDRNRMDLAGYLQHRGALVETVKVYTNQAVPLPASVRQDVEKGRWDGVLYSSPSTVTRLWNELGDSLRRIRAFSIGAETSRTLTRHGIAVSGEAPISNWKTLAATAALALAAHPIR